tara:strand:- start:618 stop:1772 length:1155 start_codon:yes stop_codon:yes gene_type:complete
MTYIYNKHNSFFGFRSKKNEDRKKIIENIKLLINDSNIISKFNSTENKIVKNINSDLFNKRNSAKNKFEISENVFDEIKDLSPENKIKYLIHRYRYEVFPQKNELDDYPPYLQIEPTSFCNYRCIFCYQTDKELTKKSNGFMGKMKLDTFKMIIDQAQGNIEFISLASRGEPLLCPDIIKMLAYTRDKFLNLKINTNASVLNEKISHAILQSGVKTVVFSADAADEKTYSKYRVNGILSKVLKNIDSFEKIRQNQYSTSKIITRVSGVKVNDNDQDLDEMEKFWGGMVDQVAFVNYIPWENVYKSKKTNINLPCSDLWRRMFVWWDGKANPCDVDYKSNLSVGDIHKDNISSIWRSESYQSLRENHLIKNKRSTIEPCNKCSVV